MSKTKENTRLAHNAFAVARNKTYTRNIYTRITKSTFTKDIYELDDMQSK